MQEPTRERVGKRGGRRLGGLESNSGEPGWFDVTEMMGIAEWESAGGDRGRREVVRRRPPELWRISNPPGKSDHNELLRGSADPTILVG